MIGPEPILESVFLHAHGNPALKDLGVLKAGSVCVEEGTICRFPVATWSFVGLVENESSGAPG